MGNAARRWAALACALAWAASSSAAEVLVRAAEARVHSTGIATDDGGWLLGRNGDVGDWFTAPADGTVQVAVKASGVPAAGGFPIVWLVLVSPDGSERGVHRFVDGSRDARDYRCAIGVQRGPFGLLVRFCNDVWDPRRGLNRDLVVHELRVSGARLADRVLTLRDFTDAAIRRHRMDTLTILTAPGAAVEVTQIRHEFWFGTAMAWQFFRNPEAPESRKYLAMLKANFNAAVHEASLKWRHTEKNAGGKADYSDADRMLAWCEANGIRVRGHCIFWAVPRFVQTWVKALDDAALRTAIERRAKEVTSRYRGRIGEYDVNNEMMRSSYYRGRLGEGIVADMARWAREVDPDARLYVNDYGVLQSGGATYARHIRGLLDRGILIGGIGIQGHCGGGMSAAKVKATLDTLAQFNLPIKITEFDMNTRDEEAKERGLETLYRVAFAHPAVDGIFMWGFWAGSHWRPAAALWRRDWTPTPAAETYRRLIFDEWWTRWRGKADEQGRCEVRAFYGTHRIKAGGKAAEVELRKRDGAKAVHLGGP